MHRLAIAIVIASISCAGRPATHRGRLPTAQPTPPAKDLQIPPELRPPRWVLNLQFEGGELCGLGVAGAGFRDSPYPKRLARERAVRNLAGVLGTQIQEAIIDEATHRQQQIRMARVITVDDALIQQVSDAASEDYWLDRGGVGPFVQKRFTYAKVCIDTHTAATLMHVSDEVLSSAAAGSHSIHPGQIPEWIDRRGTQPGGRLCNVGFSQPTFHSDKTFEAVVEDIRVKLSTTLKGLVSSYYEELAVERNGKSALAQQLITVATSDAVSKGVVVTDYWYDANGIGPYTQRRTTYGWGCVYPVEVIQSTIDKVEEKIPDDQHEVFEGVRKRARAAFENLDAEIERQESKASAPGPRDGSADSPRPGESS